MRLSGIRAVMLFVDDPPVAAAWYAVRFDTAPIVTDEFAHPELGGLELAFHLADPVKNPSGRSAVVYWLVDSVSTVRQEVPLRGPLALDANRSICQLVDPFGCVLGLDGPP